MFVWVGMQSIATSTDILLVCCDASKAVGRASTVQDGRAHVQGHSWNCAVIPESTGSVSPICLVDVPSALLGPIVCWCRP